MQPHPLRFLLAGIAAILVSPSGCSNKSESATDTGTKSLDAKSAVVQPNDNPSPSPPPRRAAESPDAAVQRLIDEIVVGKADVVWDSLPPQYRADINGLVRDLADKVDATVWRKSFETWVRLVAVLRDQHELLASSGMLAKSPIPVSEFRRIVPFLESIFQTLLDSELKDTEQLKNFDGRRFLTNTGGQLIRQLKLATKEFLPNVTWEQYSKDAVLVTALNVDGDSAVVEVMLRGSALPPTNLKMSRVEGYWIPAALASGWAASIAAARGEISKMPPVTKESQNVQLKSIAAVNGLLDELAKVETVDEFNVAAGKLLGGFFPGNISEAANTSPPSAAASPSTNTGTIHIVVTQLLDDKAIDELIERWERLSDKPEISEVDTFTKDGHTVFVVSPVSDLKTFAEGIDFVDSVDLDPKHNAIRITLPKPTTKP